MNKKLRIGIVGCGAIGSSLAKIITRDFAQKAILSALEDINCARSRDLSKRVSAGKNLAVAGLDELIRKSDLVIEAAHASVSAEIAARVIKAKRDIMIMSVGGVVGSFSALQRLADANNRRIYIPSGAIAGVDALKAAAMGKIKKVILTTRKNPRSFAGVKYVADKKIDLKKIKKDTVIFSGAARQAMKFFPQNINVAGVLSIAGIGPVKTQVRLIASPSTTRNIHEIQIQAEAGDIFTRTENILHPDNPKTSYMAVLSALATLKQVLYPARVGT